MSALHVMPRSDAIGHDPDDECPCGPTPEFTGNGFVIVHHSLDGREAHE